MAQEIKNHYIHLNSASTSATTKNSQNKNAIMEFYINNNIQINPNNRCEIALIQMIQSGASSTTGYFIRLKEAIFSGFDSLNEPIGILYAGVGLNSPQIPIYLPLLSMNLNTLTLYLSDDASTSDKLYNGFATSISFALVLHIKEYVN